MPLYSKCNQEFEDKDVLTIDEYINNQLKEVQPLLHKVKETIRMQAPNAIEKISWRMPTFWQEENLIHFAAFKNHLGIYPGDLSDSPFKERLIGYKHSKGTIQFPYNKPIDFDLIADIVRYRVETVLKKSQPSNKIYEYETIIQPSQTGKGGAYVVFPYDIRKEFNKGRVKVCATFDKEPYIGSIVNMGVKNEDGSICYIIGIRKDIREKIKKDVGEVVRVTIKERNS